MNQLASILTIALFVVFGSLGAQRIMYNETMSATAERLGFSKNLFRIIGSVEILLAVAQLATVKNAAGGLRTLAVIVTILMIAMAGGELFHNLRRRQDRKYLWPVLALLVATIVELVARLIH